MDGVEYYKSLISDEEVMKALLKESKAREGGDTKPKTRVRPNLNFFQRTVNNLVSSNKRIPVTQVTIAKKKTIKTGKGSAGERKTSQGKVKTPCAIVKEILLSNRISFVKAGELKSAELKAADSRFTTDAKPKDKIVSKSTKKDLGENLNLKVNKIKLTSTSTSVSECTKSKLPLEERSDSIISVSSSDLTSTQSSTKSEVICISDSDSDIILLDSPEKAHKRTKNNTYKAHRRKKKRTRRKST